MKQITQNVLNADSLDFNTLKRFDIRYLHLGRQLTRLGFRKEALFINEVYIPDEDGENSTLYQIFQFRDKHQGFFHHFSRFAYFSKEELFDTVKNELAYDVPQYQYFIFDNEQQLLEWFLNDSNSACST